MAKAVTTKGSIADAVSTAFGEFEELASELEQWGDNIEEKFSTTSKYESIREAQEALENLSSPDVPEKLGALEIEYIQMQGKKMSRADRCSNACMALDAAISRLEEIENDDEAESLRDDLDNAKSEAESVSFPGMYA